MYAARRADRKVPDSLPFMAAKVSSPLLSPLCLEPPPPALSSTPCLPGDGGLCGCESGVVGGGVTGFSASLFCFLSSLLDGGVDGGASRLIRVGWRGAGWAAPPTPQWAQLCRLPPSLLLEVQESCFSGRCAPVNSSVAPGIQVGGWERAAEGHGAPSSSPAVAG